MCFRMCVFLHENSKSKRSRNMKLDYIVKYENSCFSDKFDIGHCRTKVKVTARLRNFSPLPQYKLSGPITQLWYKRDSTEIWLFDVPAQYLEEEAFK